VFKYILYGGDIGGFVLFASSACIMNLPDKTPGAYSPLISHDEAHASGFLVSLYYR